MRSPSRRDSARTTRFDVPHEILRSVEGVSGTVELEMELAPRGEYGLVKPLFRQEDGGGRTFGGPNRIAVRAGVPADVTDSTMRASFEVSEGDRVGFSMRWAPVESANQPEPTAPDRVADRIDDTVDGWRPWEAEHDVYEGPHKDLVQHSSRVLKGLTYRPTARSSPPPRPPCRKRSAASATGTTASPGSATRASPSRPSTSGPARTRPRSSSRS